MNNGQRKHGMRLVYKILPMNASVKQQMNALKIVLLQIIVRNKHHKHAKNGENVIVILLVIVQIATKQLTVIPLIILNAKVKVNVIVSFQEIVLIVFMRKSARCRLIVTEKTNVIAKLQAAVLNANIQKKSVIKAYKDSVL